MDGLMITTSQMFLYSLQMVQFLCIYDSQVAEWGKIYAELEKLFDNYGVCCAVDLRFGKIAKDFFVKSTQDDLSSNKTTHKEAKLYVIVKRAAKSMQLLAEWGMSGFQASFPRIKDHFDYEEHGANQIVIKMYLLLINLRAWLVGMNQIWNLYMPYG